MNIVLIGYRGAGKSVVGKGLAEKLVRTGLAWANQQGLKIRASCWYVQKFL